MKINDFLIIDENTKKYIINWDMISSIPQFKKLKHTPQNPLWHYEGTVWTHTLFVTNLMFSKIDNNINNKNDLLLLMAALFHDIGKGETTIFNESKNSWSSPKHAEVGSEMIKDILNEENDENINIIKFYVANHMKVLFLIDSTDVCEELQKLNSTISKKDDDDYIEKLILLKECDCCGSVMCKHDNWKEILTILQKYNNTRKILYL